MHSLSTSLKISIFVTVFIGVMIVFVLPASAQMTLSGTLYTNAGVSVETATRTIAVAVGTSTPGRFSSTSVVTTGAWTVTIPTGHGIGTGTPIMIWIDGAAVDGSLITKASTSNDVSTISGLDIYRDRLIVRHEATSGTSTTNADLSFFTSAQDADLHHSTTTGGIIIEAGTELYVSSGDTFAPGGTVTIAGNAGSGVDGSFFLANSSTYIAGGTLSLAGSLSAVSGVTYTPGLHSTTFIATTTGKTINAPVTTLGNVTFSGVGGGWSFTSTNATTSNLYISAGSVSAPSGTLGVTGVFQNDATFDENNGTLHLQGIILSDVIPYIAGRDQSASATSTGNLAINRFAAVGNILYVAKAGSATACVQTDTGGASGCELMVYDISSTTNPVYVAGRDASGNATGTGNLAINALHVMGNYLYVGKAGSATACSQIAGSADGCELMVYDISSTTNPVYVAGRDASGDAVSTTSVSVLAFAQTGSLLYLTKGGNGTACSQIAGFAVGCDLMLFDISSTTNPVYVGGVDTSGSINGTENRAFNSLTLIGNYVYAYKTGSTGGCSQLTAPTVGCELMIFDFSSTTNATYVYGFDGSGIPGAFNNEDYLASAVVGNTLYLAKEFTAGTCSSSSGVGCELIMYDISSTTRPTYIGGRDSNGSSIDGSGAVSIVTLVTQGNTLYAGKGANATACGQTPGSALGCELIAFDISSTTNPQFMFGRDASGDAVGTTSVTVNNLRLVNNTLYVAKAGSATACSQTAGLAVGCELMIFDASSTQPTGIMYGNLSGSNQLNDVVVTGLVAIRAAAASTSDVTINTGSSLTMPLRLTVDGQYSNNGQAAFPLDAITVFESNGGQSINGFLSGSSTFNEVFFRGSGTKTIGGQASVTRMTIESGATVVAPNPLTLSGDLVNEGTFTSTGGSIAVQSIVARYLAGLDLSGSATGTSQITSYDLARTGTTLYVAISAGTSNPCSQVPGDANGCELQAYDISSTTNPVYVAGRDASGDSSGVISSYYYRLVVSGNVLYAVTDRDATACSQTAGSAEGCELHLYDISSTTNPVYVAGRDVSGDSSGTGFAYVQAVTVVGATLYVAKSGDPTACSQVAGSAIGCELMVFDISSTTNPVYVAGRDASGDATGTSSVSIVSMRAFGATLYVAKGGNATACSQTAGSAAGCEIMVFDISSTTNPVYVAGRDVSGDAVGVSAVGLTEIVDVGTALYVAKGGNATACSQTAGSAAGCEIMVFDISSTTNPVYVAGRDASGGAAGINAETMFNPVRVGEKLFIGKQINAQACSQTAGSAIGCELMVYDISSTTNPVYVQGYDGSGGRGGVSSEGISTIESFDNLLYLTKSSNSTACSQVQGSANGCELQVWNLGSNVAGNLSGSSALNVLEVVDGSVSIANTASTTDITIGTAGILTAPSTALSVAGDMTIHGTFEHNNGLVSFAGTDQLITAAATTTFYDLAQIATTSATTTFSTSSPFVILNDLTLQGASSSLPLRLRSVASGTQWSIDVQSSNSPTLRYLDVQDSNNIGATTTVLFCNRSCIDSGNNTNWDFSSTTPLVTLANHPLGQVNNAFSGSSLSDEPLFAFNLAPAFETATTTVALSLANTIGLTSSNLTDWRLYRDTNANQIVDGGDVQVGGAGTFATTSVIFGTAFLVSTSSAYIVTADAANIKQGDRITISLETGSVMATSTETGELLPVVGAVSSTNHLRSKKGGGGGSVNFVNIGAPGNGVVGGGTNEGGQELGGEPNFNAPTTNGSPHNEWTSGASGYLSDGAYASETTAGQRQSYATYGFNIPTNNEITGIEVKLEASATTPAGTIDVALSWDNGSSITTVQSTATLTTTDTIYTLGSPSDLWGRAWVPSEFSNGTFGLRIIGQPSGGNTVQVDAIQVRVYHQATGGGSGGGSSEL